MTFTDSPPRRRLSVASLSLRGGVLLSIAVFFANVSNYLFHVLAGRWLGPGDYGLLSSVFTLVAIFGVSASSLQAACAKGEALHGTRGMAERKRSRSLRRALGEPLVRIVLAVSVGLSALTVVASPLLGRFFHSNIGPVIGFAVLLPWMGIVSVVFGRLQGLGRFVLFAAVSFSLAVGKLVIGAATIGAGLGATGAVFAIAVTTCAGSMLGLWFVSDVESLPVSVVADDIVRALVALTVFWALLSIDVPLARHWMSADDAGQYAAASVIGKGILWLPDVVALVVFPQLASAVRSGNNSRRIMMQAVAASVGLCVTGCVGLWLVGGLMFDHLYGEGYGQAASLAWKVGIVSVPLAVANLLMFLHLASAGWRWIALPIVVLVAETIGFGLFHGSATAFIVVSFVAAVVLVALLAGAAAMGRDGRTPT
jgi:O-antigen/teichoic acid export membrane protein